MENDRRLEIRIDESHIEINEAVEFVSNNDCGAISTFLGVTRKDFPNDDREKGTKYLVYDCYHPMARKETERICQQAFVKHGVKCIFVHHKLGRVDLGAASIVIAASAPHRAARSD
ncbi:molybdopterin synthase catalytic subunit-like isoform X2 [Convolutriloba macropyga]|uniref:molybdopterin synthase catalytic subunit-like isoform X2 n=1 Tax=Convolutriloba macropyga TaxID=536237 RepID=UPI003F51FDCF